MKAQVKRVKDLSAVLKDLERYVKAPQFLYSGRAFRNFGLLPREVLGNWMICAVGNFEDSTALLTFGTDPMGGDGIVVNKKDGDVFFTEHVFIPRAASTATTTVEDLMCASVDHKAKKGAAYARGRHLVIFSEATGLWYPSRAARRIAGTHAFTSVWALHIDRGDDVEYVYSVTLLDAAREQAPVWKVVIGGDFKSWRVLRIQ